MPNGSLEEVTSVAVSYNSRTKAMPDEKSLASIASSLAVVLPRKRTRSLSKEHTKSRAKPMPYATSTQNSAESVSSQDPCDSTPLRSDHTLQRANGAGRIVLTGSESGTRIVEVLQCSPIRVLFPRTAGIQVQEAVLVNTSGGIAGGDRLEYSVTADNASIAVTTQAAEKVYRAINKSAHVTTTLSARDAAKLAWLPQETIVFNRARICRRTQIEVSSGSELLALEWLVLGRAAHGENISAGDIMDSWRVTKDGRLVWADSFRATDEVFSHLSRKALLSDCTALATLLYFGPDLEERLQVIRDLASPLECQCAATLVGGLMVVRFAAKVSNDLRAALRNLLQQFGNQLAPGPFRVPKMWSC
jgi:urease accessory protein